MALRAGSVSFTAWHSKRQGPPTAERESTHAHILPKLTTRTHTQTHTQLLTLAYNRTDCMHAHIHSVTNVIFPA